MSRRTTAVPRLPVSRMPGPGGSRTSCSWRRSRSGARRSPCRPLWRRCGGPGLVGTLRVARRWGPWASGRGGLSRGLVCRVEWRRLSIPRRRAKRLSTPLSKPLVWGWLGLGGCPAGALKPSRTSARLVRPRTTRRWLRWGRNTVGTRRLRRWPVRGLPRTAHCWRWRAGLGSRRRTLRMRLQRRTLRPGGGRALRRWFQPSNQVPPKIRWRVPRWRGFRSAVSRSAPSRRVSPPARLPAPARAAPAARRCPTHFPIRRA